MIYGITSNGTQKGKDTVAKMIQYFYATPLTKSKMKNFFKEDKMPYSIQEFLSSTFEKTYIGSPFHFSISSDSGFEIKPFSQKLKEIASIILGVPVRKFEDGDFKGNYCVHLDTLYISRNCDIGKYKEPYNSYSYENVKTKISVGYYDFYITIRLFLQLLGTEVLRGFSPNIHVNMLLREFVTGANWIIPDVRFNNEYEAIKSHEAIIIKVVRGEVSSSHESDTNEIPYDYLIENNGTIEELYEKVSKILIQCS